MIGFDYLGKLGQLGNQMFQYAATMGIADKIGVGFKIPKHDEIFDDGIGNKLHIELFDCFDIKPNIGFINSGKVYQQSGFEFDDSVFDIKNDDFTLYGFYQTEKYFIHIQDKVRKEFTFKQHIVDECKNIIDNYFDNPISLHIRRGDFLTNSGNHYNQSLEYYADALSKFEKGRQVIIFSDDPAWCMEQDLFSDDSFIISEQADSYHDLYMMTQCNDFIIANSSFSWWGAWLANRGRVIAPKKWFGPNNAHLNTKDLYPNHWEVI